MINISENDLMQLTDDELKGKLYDSKCKFDCYKEELRRRSSKFIDFFGDIGSLSEDEACFDDLPTVEDLKTYVEYCMTYDREDLGSIDSDPYEPYRFTSLRIPDLIACLKHALEVKNNESYRIVSNCLFEKTNGDSQAKPNIYFSIIKASDYDKKYDQKVLNHDDLYKNIIENKNYVVTIPLYCADYTKRTWENGAEFDYEILRSNYSDYDILTFGNLFQTFYARYPKVQNVFKVYGEIYSNITKVSDILKMYINSDDELIAKTIFGLIRYRVSFYIINNEMNDLDYKSFTELFLGERFDVVSAARSEISTNYRHPRGRRNK